MENPGIWVRARAGNVAGTRMPLSGVGVAGMVVAVGNVVGVEVGL